MIMPPITNAPQEAPIIIFQCVFLSFSLIDMIIRETKPNIVKSKPTIFISIHFYTFLQALQEQDPFLLDHDSQSDGQEANQYT